MELTKLIKKHGPPEAIVDYNGNSSTHYAVWGFEEIIELNQNGVYLNEKPMSGEPMQILQSTLDNWKEDSNNIAAVGYFSYDLKKTLFPHISFKPESSDDPLFWFGKPKKTAPFNCISDIEPEPILSKSPIENFIAKSEFLNQLQTIKSHLEMGDVYQVNYTYPKSIKVDGDPLDTYLSLSWHIVPRRGFYLFDGYRHILSLSPEEFIKVQVEKDGRKISTYPMKGTRPEGKDEFERRFNILELSESEKDKAEHLMIVDLLRNDLGKICQFESIHVKNLYGIQTYESVHHMVSEVHGKLNNNTKETDIISALFPGGSITGAPKERAMQIIDNLETYNRGIYTGSMGFITANGEVDFNIAIRTMSVKNGIATYPVGGGIVWDSDPEEEWEETQVKAAILKKLFSHELQQLKKSYFTDS